MRVVLLWAFVFFGASTSFAQSPRFELGSMLEGLVRAALYGARTVRTSVPRPLTCEMYKVGEFRAFQNSIGAYGIRKVALDRYDAFFNLRFTAAAGTDPQKAVEMRARVQKCYADVGVLTAGPTANLTLNLASEQSEFAKKIPVVDIVVTDGNIRGHTRNYAVNFTCLTIVHETLHYMGLLDEYDGKYDGYNCRVMNDSIMSSHYAFGPTPFGIRRVDNAKNPDELGLLQRQYFAENPNGRFVAVDEVDCLYPDSSKRNKSLGDSLRTFKRVNDTNFERSHYSHIFIPDWKRYEQGEYFYVLESDLETTSKKTTIQLNSHLTSLFRLTSGRDWTCRVVKLNPSVTALGSELAMKLEKSFSAPERLPLRYGHFRKFLFPNCEAKNKVYDLCTRDAYKATATATNCLKDTVPVCQDRAWLE